MCVQINKGWWPWGQNIVRFFVLFRSSSPDSQNVSVQLSVKLPIIACRLEALISTEAVKSFKDSTKDESWTKLGWFSFNEAMKSSISSLLDNILLMLLNTWDLCKNEWSEELNRIPQHFMAICCKAEPIGSRTIRSAMVCSRVWNVFGNGYTASPARATSDKGCSQTFNSYNKCEYTYFSNNLFFIYNEVYHEGRIPKY